MVKEFTYRGKTMDEMLKMDTNTFATLLTSRKRRALTKNLLERNKPLIAKVKKAREEVYKKPIKTHARDMIVLPDMVGLTIHVHTGKIFVPIKITEEMLGFYLGELTTTRQKVEHSAPGIGATKSSTAVASKAK